MIHSRPTGRPFKQPFPYRTCKLKEGYTYPLSSKEQQVKELSSANLETVQCEYSERVHDDASHPELCKAARVLGEEVHFLQAARDKPSLSR